MSQQSLSPYSEARLKATSQSARLVVVACHVRVSDQVPEGLPALRKRSVADVSRVQEELGLTARPWRDVFTDILRTLRVTAPGGAGRLVRAKP